MTKFAYIQDPGHGWLQVGWESLKDLGFNPTDFSRYSYRNRNTFYLEEDCDMPLFLAAYEKKHGEQPVLVEQHVEYTRIRDLPSIY